MKKLSTVLLLASLASCYSFPGLDDTAQVSVAPYLALYETVGTTRMQFASGGNVFEGDQLNLDDIGIGRREEDWGVVVRYGDGFSGFRADYFQLRSEDSREGTVLSNYGAIDLGDIVETRLKMDEWRVRYVARVWGHEEDDEEERWWIKTGIGLGLATRTLKMRVREVSAARQQSIEFRDEGVPELIAKIGGGYGPVAGVFEFRYNDDVTWGGDFDGIFQDIELRTEYLLEDQDIKLFAGYRQQDLSADDEDDLGLQNRSRFRIRGFFLGAEFRF